MYSLSSLFFVIIACVAPNIDATCNIEINNPAPLGIITIGSKKLLISSSTNSLSLNVGESITFQCLSRVIYPNSESSQASKLTLNCGITGITGPPVVRSTYSGYSTYNSVNIDKYYVKCESSLEKSLYESHKNLSNCNDYISYGIGYKLDGAADQILLGICYDLNTFQIKYVTYVPKAKGSILMSKKLSDAVSAAVSLDVKVPNFVKYTNMMSDVEFQKGYDLIKNNDWLQPLEFEFDSLMQNSDLTSEISAFKDMFNVIWWKSLKQGNWKLFQQLLKVQTTQMEYRISEGTWGTLTLPSIKCNSTEKLSVQYNDKKLHAFEYIWTSVKSQNKSSDEDFVVIGFNSPIFKFHSMKKIVFCKDMCHEIAWLQQGIFKNSRMMPEIGLVFCCHPEDVAEKFNNYPKIQQKLKPSTSTTKPVGNNFNNIWDDLNDSDEV